MHKKNGVGESGYSTMYEVNRVFPGILVVTSLVFSYFFSSLLWLLDLL